MRRDKVWWARLTKRQRSELWWLERDEKGFGHSSMMPDDCSECGSCGTPHLGYGLCPLCYGRLTELLEIANGERPPTIEVYRAEIPLKDGAWKQLGTFATIVEAIEFMWNAGYPVDNNGYLALVSGPYEEGE